MATPDHDQNQPRYYKTAFFAELGTYNTDKTAPGKAAEVLVGRNKERASFISRLLNSGRGGAYLITGQRGTGKTSFVDYCMDVYQQDVFTRFVHSGRVKSGIEKIISLASVVTLIVFPLFLTNLLLASNGHLGLLISLPLLVFCFALLRLAYRQLIDGSYIYTSKNNRSKIVIGSGFLVIVLTVAFAFVNFWYGVVISLVVFPVLLALFYVLFIGSVADKDRWIKARLFSIELYKSILCLNYTSVILLAIIACYGRNNLVNIPMDGCLGCVTITNHWLIVIIIAVSVFLVVWLEKTYIFDPHALIEQKKIFDDQDSKKLPSYFAQANAADFAAEHDDKVRCPLKERLRFRNYYQQLQQYTCVGAGLNPQAFAAD